jgi:disulfide bond formation protein DsbB
MFRYALIIIAFLVLMAYVIYMGARGAISGTFRTISLVLLALLLILVGTALYYTGTQYSVQTVHEEFAADKTAILNSIRQNLAQKNYEQATDQAERYLDVNDPELKRLYEQSREAQLLQRLDQLPEDDHRQRLQHWKELLELTGKTRYKQRMATERQRLNAAREQAILDVLQSIPEAHIGQRALGFSLLEALDPDNPLYAKKQNSYQLSVEERIQETPWSDVCSRTSLKACEHFGYLASRPATETEAVSGEAFGEILGVSHRPKGALISRDGRVAPENGHYYIVHDFAAQTLVLYSIDYLHVHNPYETIR